MKKRLSAYWWCQIVGWSILYVTILYLTNFIWDIVLFSFLGVPLGIFTTHLMRLFIIKAGIFQSNVFRQMIYMLLMTLFFSFIYSLLILAWVGILHWAENFFPDKWSITLLLGTLTNSTFLGIWNVIYFSYHHIQKSQKEQIEKIRLENELQLQKLESEKHLANLEMQALRAQMNPHFIFNSLNSISRFILKNQRIEANDYLTKFSRLIRMILQNSAMPTVKLSDELNILQLYLELECLRFDKKIMYEFQCDPDLDTELIEIPPMLLQPYIENAIWHGLMLKEEEGHLWIKIRQQEKYLVCTITDDGIGREKYAELKKASTVTHKSMGLKITESRIAMMQIMDGENKSVEIRNLVEADGRAAGTEVVLRIPHVQEV